MEASRVLAAGFNFEQSSWNTDFDAHLMSSGLVDTSCIVSGPELMVKLFNER